MAEIGIATRWDIAWGEPFKIGIDRAQELLDTGEARFKRNGSLDMRFGTSKLIGHYFPAIQA